MKVIAAVLFACIGLGHVTSSDEEPRDIVPGVTVCNTDDDCRCNNNMSVPPCWCEKNRSTAPTQAERFDYGVCECSLVESARSGKDLAEEAPTSVTVGHKAGF